jgi:hypothetical protein
MYPNYRDTAEQRQERAIRFIGVFAAVVAIGLAAGVVYAVLHFAAKFW